MKDWHWERVLPDETLWGITIPKSELFFMNCILPELVGKFYIKAQEDENVSTVANDHTSLKTVFCYCKQPGFGTMIGCDSIQCTIEWWFHIDCLKLKSIPDGQCFCPEYQTSRKNTNTKK